MVILLMGASVICGFAGAVMTIYAGFGLLPALLGYSFGGLAGAGVTVIWAIASQAKSRHETTKVAACVRPATR